MAKVINAWAIEWTQRDAWAVNGTQRESEKKLGSLHGEGNTLETLGPIRIGHSDTRLPMAK